MWRAAAAASVCVLLAACSDTASAPPPQQSSAGPVEAMYAVDGHDLFARCRPGASPYLVYLHGLGGSSTDLDGLVDSVADRRPRQGFCVYDRLNAGRSDNDPARRTLAESTEELGDFLAAAEIPPPYTLVAHSYGGLLATSYAGRNPADVAAVVLADAALPFEQALFTPTVRATVRSLASGNTEHVDLLAAFAEAARARLPDVPVVYVDATQEDLATQWGARGYQQALGSFLDSLTRGTLVRADTDHLGVLSSEELVDAVVGVAGG